MADSPFTPLAPLDGGHDRAAFDCGVPALNLYLRNYALQNQKRGIVRNYVTTPAGCPGLKFEDPRLSKFMAAPPKLAAARPAHRTHVTVPAEAGHVILFESWLRHEVAANQAAGERISISFNFNWS